MVWVSPPAAAAVAAAAGGGGGWREEGGGRGGQHYLHYRTIGNVVPQRWNNARNSHSLNANLIGCSFKLHGWINIWAMCTFSSPFFLNKRVYFLIRRESVGTSCRWAIHDTSPLYTVLCWDSMLLRFKKNKWLHWYLVSLILTVSASSWLTMVWHLVLPDFVSIVQDS